MRKKEIKCKQNETEREQRSGREKAERKRSD